MVWQNYFIKKNFVPKITQSPSQNLELCVVIPCFNEPQLDLALESLAQCELPGCDVEVIVVVNHPENSEISIIDASLRALNLVERYNKGKGSKRIQYHAIKAFNLPRKHAGVGLARQIGMDEAAYRLLSVSGEGIIACFDADSQCIPNYLVELFRFWQMNPKAHANSIRFEHPLKGNEFPQTIYDGIAIYELHLRYYNQALRFINFPFAYHTVGSSMACSASAYVRFGGMNRHQAGEDFYFLQKIIPHGHFGEVNSTCVFPSPRPSNRVPFGTGRAMSKLVNQHEPITTYHLDSFLSLRPFFDRVDSLFNFTRSQTAEFLKSLPLPLSEFLVKTDATEALENVRRNSASVHTFRKRFFLWFDAFMMLKYMNYSAENYYGRVTVIPASIALLHLMGKIPYSDISVIELLSVSREIEKAEWVSKL